MSVLYCGGGQLYTYAILIDTLITANHAPTLSEKVDFDESQSVDEPQDSRHTLGDRRTVSLPVVALLRAKIPRKCASFCKQAVWCHGRANCFSRSFPWQPHRVLVCCIVCKPASIVPLDPQPDKAVKLPAPARAAKTKKDGPRARIPWSEDEVKHLKAAVMALGKGRWTLALAQYKFNPCRTSVDLKDKWRNLSKG